jgi:hypothetical protein
MAINDLTSRLEGDGTRDACDSCPDTLNADQADADGNGTGDVCQLMPQLSRNEASQAPSRGARPAVRGR